MKSCRTFFTLLLISWCSITPLSAQEFSGNASLDQFRIAEENVVLLENINEIIPLKRLDSLKIAYLPIGFDTLEIKGKPYAEDQLLRERLESYKVPVKVKISDDKQHGERYKKLRS